MKPQKPAMYYDYDDEWLSIICNRRVDDGEFTVIILTWRIQ